MNPRSIGGFLLLIAAALLGVQNISPAPAPGPLPDPAPVDPAPVVLTLDRVAEQVQYVEAQLKAKVYRDVAALIRKGEIKTAEAFEKYLQSNIGPTRESAGQALKDLMAKEIPDLTFDDAEKVAAKVDLIAEGMERVKK